MPFAKPSKKPSKSQVGKVSKKEFKIGLKESKNNESRPSESKNDIINQIEISNASSSLSSESSGTLDSVHTKKAKERKSKTTDKKDPKIEFQ